MAIDGQNLMTEIKEKLLSDAKKEAEEIIERAKAEAEEIIRKSESDWQRRFEEFKREEIKRAIERGLQIESDARLRARIIISQAKAEVIGKILKDAEVKIANREFDVKASLRALLSATLTEATAIKRIVVSPRDRPVVEQILSESNLRDLIIEENDGILGGLIVESSEGIIYDNSYDTRLRILREKMLDRLQNILWGEYK